MSMKKLLIFSYSIITLTILILGILNILMSQNEYELNTNQEQRYQSYLLADQLRQSSDDLTRMARTYVVTGDSKYEKIYRDILAIRNGEKSRPKYYDRIYWDMVLNYGDKPRAEGDTISLQALMKRAGFTEEEFDKLHEAKNNSDGLVKTEMIAMNAVKGLYDDGNGNYVKKGTPDFEMARRIMHNEQYHSDKAAIMKPIDEFFQLLNERTQTEVDFHTKKANFLLLMTQIVVIFSIILSVIIGFFVTMKILKQVGGEPAQIAQIAEQVADGNFDMRFESTKKTVTGIYAALQIMIKNLKSLDQESEEQNWLKTGQAQLNEKISGEQNIKQLAENTINFLSPYVEAQVGAFYLLEENDEQQPRLRIIATHAYVWRKNSVNTFEIGEGIVGQSAYEKKMFIITKPPEDYIQIQSGLGESLPVAILVIPFLYENTLKGIIELASFNRFTGIQLQFIQQVMSNIAIAVNTAESRTKMQHLLEKSQAQAGELQTQQAELQQTNEELQSQTEELKTQQEELQTQQEELRHTNEELQIRGQDLERQQKAIREKNTELEKAKTVIQTKAEELEIASKYKSEFLANMSHELRTPLNSTLILSQLLANNKEGNLTEQQKEYASTIYKSGNELLRLINDILDLSKVEAGKIEVNLEELAFTELKTSMEQKFCHIAEDKGLDFTVDLAEVLSPTFYTDEQRLTQIITNLLSNAFKFTKQGSVTLEIRQPAANIDLSHSTLKPTESIAIRVIDTGIGISPDKQKIIFEAFQQADNTTSRSYGGTGLGLSISKQLSRLLGGEIQLYSEEGKGSTFTLYLPEKLEINGKSQDQQIFPNPHFSKWETNPSSQTSFSTSTSEKSISSSTVSIPQEQQEPKEQQKSIPDDDRQDLQLSDKSLLIIEDERDFSKILVDMAREKYFKCLLAEDGKSGLELAKKYKPSAIILDVGLPQVDGLTVMEKIKDNPDCRHIPVYFVSGSDANQDARKMGAIGYSMKPVNIDELDKAFKHIESFIAKTVKNLLVVVDNPEHRQAIMNLLEGGNIQLTIVATRAEAWQHLQSKGSDCMILDVDIEQNANIRLLEQLYNEPLMQQIPTIIYTERDLTLEEETLLQKCVNNMTIKIVHSLERLLDETTLFLHQVESTLPQKQQQILHKVHDKEAILVGKKVLIVDDDMRNVFSLATTLEKRNMEIVIANTGQEALSELDKNPDTAVVLMDVMMPKMDGYEAMQKIRTQFCFRKLPIIALTAKAMKGDKAKCIQAGANDYLPKPIDTDKLLSLLRVWLYQ
ncbi:response regulator [Candidatus Parabeggiatoa sp. HSG14]|uniref:response regulator n=1 Tax=Candidatus Parabeggiatoa sp. HSG14 TaxID=3055593 RepID=UPI0025A8F35D|nr:response regulator [Thiotrichales bacterium HSG14]